MSAALPARRLSAKLLSNNSEGGRFLSLFVSIWIQCLGIIVLLRSEEFDAWLAALADAKGKARILARLRSATFGNFGDCEPVGEGVSEMRVHVGPGYRVYFMRTERTVYLLLSGGDKATQRKDIARAQTMARAVREFKP